MCARARAAGHVALILVPSFLLPSSARLIKLDSLLPDIESPSLTTLGRSIDFGAVQSETPAEKRSVEQGLRHALRGLQYNQRQPEVFRVRPRFYRIADLRPMQLFAWRQHVLVRTDNQWWALRDVLFKEGLELATPAPKQPLYVPANTNTTPRNPPARADAVFSADFDPKRTPQSRQATPASTPSNTERILEKHNKELESQLYETRVRLQHTIQSASIKDQEIKELSQKQQQLQIDMRQQQLRMEQDRRRMDISVQKSQADSQRHLHAMSTQIRTDAASREKGLHRQLDEMEYFDDLHSSHQNTRMNRVVEVERKEAVAEAEAEAALRLLELKRHKDKEIAELRAKIAQLLARQKQSSTSGLQIEHLMQQLKDEQRDKDMARNKLSEVEDQFARFRVAAPPPPNNSGKVANLEAIIQQLRSELDDLQEKARLEAIENRKRAHDDQARMEAKFRDMLNDANTRGNQAKLDAQNAADRLRDQMAAEHAQRLRDTALRAAQAEAELARLHAAGERDATMAPDASVVSSRSLAYNPADELRELRERLAQSEADLAREQQLRRDAASKQAQQLVAEYEARLKAARDELAAQRARHDTRLAELQQQLRDTAQKLLDEQQNGRLLQDQRSKTAAADAAAATLQDQITDLQSNLSAKEAALRTSESQQDTLQRELEDMQRQQERAAAEARQKMERASRDASHRGANVASLEDHVADLERQLRMKESALKLSDDQLESLRSELAELQRQNDQHAANARQKLEDAKREAAALLAKEKATTEEQLRKLAEKDTAVNKFKRGSMKQSQLDLAQRRKAQERLKEAEDALELERKRANDAEDKLREAERAHKAKLIELEAQQRRDFDAQQRKMQKEHDEIIRQLKAATRELETNLARANADMERDRTAASDNMSRQTQQNEDAHSQLASVSEQGIQEARDDADRRIREAQADAAEKIRQAENEMRKVQDELLSVSEQLAAALAEAAKQKESFAVKLSEAEAAAQAEKSRADKLAGELAQALTDHESGLRSLAQENAESGQSLHAEHISTLADLQAQLTQNKENHQGELDGLAAQLAQQRGVHTKELAVLKENHQGALDELAAQLAQAEKDHAAALESLRQEHAESGSSLNAEHSSQVADLQAQLAQATLSQQEDLNVLKTQSVQAESDHAAALASLRQEQEDIHSAKHADLQAQVEQERSHHTRELAVIKDSHLAELDALRRQLDERDDEIMKHLETIKKLEERIRELEEQLRLFERKMEDFKELEVLLVDRDKAAEAAAWNLCEAQRKLAMQQADKDELEPFRIDICTWLNELFRLKTPIMQETLLRSLNDGVILCNLAKRVNVEEEAQRKTEKLENKASFMKKDHFEPKKIPKRSASNLSERGSPKGSPSRSKKNKTGSPGAKRKEKGPITGLSYAPADATSNCKEFISQRPTHNPVCFEDAFKGSASARSNVASFLKWANALGIEEPDAFDVDDLVAYKNPRNVIFGLYDVARRFRTLVPKFVSYERSLWHPRHRTNTKKDDPVDKAVTDILVECVCSPRLELTRIEEKKYMMSGQRKPLLVSLVDGKTRQQVNVRVGGGWQNFRQFIETHDKCRSDKHAIKIKGIYKQMIEQLKKDAARSTVDHTHVSLFTNRPLSSELHPTLVPTPKNSETIKRNVRAVSGGPQLAASREGSAASPSRTLRFSDTEYDGDLDRSTFPGGGAGKW